MKELFEFDGVDIYLTVEDGRTYARVVAGERGLIVEMVPAPLGYLDVFHSYFEAVDGYIADFTRAPRSRRHMDYQPGEALHMLVGEYMPGVLGEYPWELLEGVGLYEPECDCGGDNCECWRIAL